MQTDSSHLLKSEMIKSFKAPFRDIKITKNNKCSVAVEETRQARLSMCTVGRTPTRHVVDFISLH